MPILAGQIRLFEWVAGLIILSFGIHLALFPDALNQSRFRSFADVITVPKISFYCTVIGLYRLSTLYFCDYLTTKWVRTCAVIRAACAILCAVVWVQMGIALAKNAIDTGVEASIGVDVYIWMTVGEIVATYRAMLHVIRA